MLCKINAARNFKINYICRLSCSKKSFRDNWMLIRFLDAEYNADDYSKLLFKTKDAKSNNNVKQ